MSTLARKEALIDTGARHGGPARSRPAGELAEELFREQVQGVLEGYAEEGGWPYPDKPGIDIAEMYGRHFGYQFWQKYYEPLKANPLTAGTTGIKLDRDIAEQF